MISTSQAQTEQFGMSLAAQLRPGDVLFLRGDLGAGKSVLARGIARGLGVEGPIPSPTFTLMNCYEGRIPFHHFDLYRLEDEEAFYAAGLEEYVGGDAVAVIEWAERAEDALPACHLEIHLSYAGQEDTRDITILPVGGFREVLL